MLVAILFGHSKDYDMKAPSKRHALDITSLEELKFYISLENQWSFAWKVLLKEENSCNGK